MKLITDWIESDEGYETSHEFDHTFIRRFFFLHQRVRLVKYHNLENLPDDVITYPQSTYLFTTTVYPINDKYLTGTRLRFKFMIIKYNVINYIFGSSYNIKFNSINSPKLWSILDKKYPFFEKLFKDRIRDKKLNELGI